MMRIEVVIAWPDRYLSRTVQLAEGARVADAVREAAMNSFPEVAGYAVYGMSVQMDTLLCNGDRVELLRSLILDPKQARRRRAERRKA